MNDVAEIRVQQRSTEKEKVEGQTVTADYRARIAVALISLCGFWTSVAGAQADSAAQTRQMTELGLEHDSAWALFETFRKRAHGGQKLAWNKIPDWEGIYVFELASERKAPEPDFTPEFRARWLKTIEDAKKGIEYESTASCVSPGMPRWLVLPHLRQHIITPSQVTLITETFNLVRMVYTDGRGHLPEEQRYPTETGDSIGFWDGDRLVIHTNQMMANIYGPQDGEYTDQVETVEIWRKTDGGTLEADVWIYDPPALLKPWYAKRIYKKLDDPDKRIRLRHYACYGNPNNDVIQTEDGGSQYRRFAPEVK